MIDIDPFAHKATMICTFVLLVKFTVTILIQGGKRFAGGTRPPEDAKLSLSKLYKAKQTYGMEPDSNNKHREADIRWQRIVHNDMENIFLGLIVAWGSLFSAASPGVHAVSVVVFTLARIFHTVTYANEMQPHRGIAWLVAVLSVFVIGTNGVIGVL